MRLSMIQHLAEIQAYFGFHSQCEIKDVCFSFKVHDFSKATKLTNVYRNRTYQMAHGKTYLQSKIKLSLSVTNSRSSVLKAPDINELMKKYEIIAK